MTTPAVLPAIKTTLIDVTKCIGCRACQVACKQWNEKDGEETELLGQLGFQNPATLSAKTFTLISAHELEMEGAPEDFAGSSRCVAASTASSRPASRPAR